ncbi:MAG: LytTR family transcriptional regulator [Gemmatimonadaceae bacterium]|nr:LytTR family transcriptional regulator [Gemmatimonadaceae bacterium]
MTLNGRSFTPTSFTRPQPSAATPGGRVADVRVPLVLAEREGGPVSGAPASRPVPAASPYLDRIVVRSRSRILFLDVAEVTWLEAFGNYVRFHTPGEVYTVRGTLTSFEKELDPSRFVRIHRSVIVNRDVIRELHSRRTGDFTLVTSSGEQLTLSRNFRSKVPELRRRLAS